MKISIVSPIYKGEKMLHELVQRVSESVQKVTEDYEIILVNDCSPDDSWPVIQAICAVNERVKGINLSRNFGQHPAISAGLTYCTGDWVVVMDCDLQDRPEEIPNLYQKAQEGFDIVLARRVNKHFSKWKVFTSWLFHKVFDWLAGVKTDPMVGNFGIYKKNVIDAVCAIQDQNRGFGTLLRYVGFSKTTLDVEHADRAEGTSGYTLRKLFALAFNNILSNTNRPLKFAVKLGFTMSIIATLLAMYNIIARLAGIITLQGYTTTVFSIWFVGGLLLFIMGVLGLYISKIFDQVKGRQAWIVKDELNV